MIDIVVILTFSNHKSLHFRWGLILTINYNKTWQTNWCYNKTDVNSEIILQWNIDLGQLVLSHLLDNITTRFVLIWLLCLYLISIWYKHFFVYIFCTDFNDIELTSSNLPIPYVIKVYFIILLSQRQIYFKQRINSFFSLYFTFFAHLSITTKVLVVVQLYCLSIHL